MSNQPAARPAVKTGANRQDVNRIRELEEGGFDASEISLKLRVDEKCVASFMQGEVDKDTGNDPNLDLTEE